MAKWILEDDCLAPRGQIKIEYVGTNPFKIYQKVRDILSRVWGITSVDLWERDFKWDTTADPRQFYVRIYVNKGIDSRSRFFVEVVIQGIQPSDIAKEGKVTILLSAKLKTEYERKSAFQKLPIYKGFLKIYNKLFYRDVRRGYLKICQSLVDKTWREFRTNLNIPVA